MNEAGVPVPDQLSNRNNVWAARAAARTALGMSMKAASGRIVASAAHAGLEFIRFDLSGDSVPISMLPGLVEASLKLKLTPLVRVASADQIADVFAAGVLGVTLPNVRNAAHARELAAICGSEGEHLGDALLVWVQIESIEALADVQLIAAVPGLHMLQSGRNDLAKSMGLPGQPGHDRVLRAEEQIAGAARGSGKMFSLHFAPGADSIEQARTWISRRIDCITIGADTQILDEALRLRIQSISRTQHSSN